MIRSIFAAILIFAFCLTVSAQKKSRNPLSVKTGATKKLEASQEINKIFEVLFFGLDLKEKLPEDKSLAFSNSSEQNVQSFLKKFPVAYKNIVSDFSYQKNYKFTQAYYETYFIVFSLGNESDAWKEKLYSVSFNINFPGKQIAEDETRIYEKLKQLYGKYTKIEKFRYFTGEESDLNLYLWKFPKLTVTYRSFYDEKKQATIAVVEYWDSQFYKTHPYYNQ